MIKAPLGISLAVARPERIAASMLPFQTGDSPDRHNERKAMRPDESVAVQLPLRWRSMGHPGSS